MLYDEKTAVEFAKRMMDKGDIRGGLYPVVPKGKSKNPTF